MYTVNNGMDNSTGLAHACYAITDTAKQNPKAPKRAVPRLSVGSETCTNSKMYTHRLPSSFRRNPCLSYTTRKKEVNMMKINDIP